MSYYGPQYGYPAEGGAGYYPPAARRPFYIISEMHGKVLDIRGGNRFPGAEVIMWWNKRDRSPNQLWFCDELGCIRSMLNDFAPECRGQGDRLHMEPYRGDPRQQWRFEGNRIVNRVYPQECLDIERAEVRDDAQVIAWPYKASINQHWRVEYV
jgi:hypothetical protein